MNNSFDRLIEGMTEALRLHVLPATEGEFPRGQLFGIIFALNTLRLRAGWSESFVRPQIEAIETLEQDLAAIEGLPQNVLPFLPASTSVTVDALMTARDDGDAAICRLIEWLDGGADGVAENSATAARAAIDRYIHRQLRHEITTSAKPMFAQISLGRDLD